MLGGALFASAIQALKLRFVQISVRPSSALQLLAIGDNLTSAKDQFLWQFPLFTEGFMKKFMLTLLAIIALSGATVVAYTNSASAYPPGPVHGHGDPE
jgi:hypothetical protein